MPSLDEWVLVVRGLKNCVVVVEGRRDAYALLSRGVSLPFLTCNERRMRMIRDRLDASFFVLKTEHQIRAALILTDFDREGEVLHAFIKNSIIKHVDVRDDMRYSLKNLLKTNWIEDVRDFRISDLNASVIYQSSDLAPLKYVVMKFLGRLGRATLGELSSLLRRSGIRVTRNRVRTELRDLSKKTYASYDELSSRYALSKAGVGKLKKSLLTIRIKKLDEKFSEPSRHPASSFVYRALNHGQQ